MEEILLHPTLWIIIVVILISVIVASMIINGKRSKEVQALDKMFPEGKLASQNLEKIPVEKVRRHAMERERKKKEREKELPKRIRPKEGEKIFAEEDQEFILNTTQQRFSSDEENMRPKPLKPRSSVSDHVNPNMNQPFDQQLDQQQMNQSQTFSSNNEETKAHAPNSQRFRTRLKPSDQINETETQEDQTISSKLKPFSRSNRSQQSKDQQSSYAKKPFPPRSKRNKQDQTDNRGENEEPKQPFNSRSSKYSVKKRFF